MCDVSSGLWNVGCVWYIESMRTHIWIRKENEDFWNSIENKSEWLNAILKQNDPIGPVSEAVPVLKIRVDGVSSKTDDHRYGEPVLRDTAHMTSTSNLVSGMERACCLNAKPCQHWSFNGESWVNSLSGRKRETE